MSTIELVRNFILDQCDYNRPLGLQDDIFHRIGITGDDADEFIHSFGDKFEIDMSEFRWYFHFAEEGSPNLIFKSPDQMVDRIPITLQLLVDIAETGVWAVGYPQHDLPKVRKDIVVNWIWIGLVIAFVFIAIA